MASTTRDNRADGVEFIHEDDGRITARDLETGVASYGETKAEALVKACHRKDLITSSLSEIGTIIFPKMACRSNLLTQYHQKAGVWRIL